MSVGRQLGFSSAGPEPIDHDKWSAWCARFEALGRFDDLRGAQCWLETLSTDKDADEVLWPLAQLAAVDGGDDLDAARWLAWLLVGGASLQACRLAGVDQVDEAVAAALWLEVRSFPWRTRRRVAANVRCGVRARVLHDCGRSNRRRAYRAQRGLVLVPNAVDLEECGPLWVSEAEAESSAARLQALLDWAIDEEVISAGQRALLVCLIEAMERMPGGVNGGPEFGLFGDRVSEAVALQLGLSPRTARRHAKAAVDALVGAADRYRASA